MRFMNRTQDNENLEFIPAVEKVNAEENSAQNGGTGEKVEDKQEAQKGSNPQKQTLDQKKDEKDDIQNFGHLTLEEGSGKKKIELMTIIGEIEGHDCLAATSKTTKYEHVLPALAKIEDDDSAGGILFLINTVGGDVSAGLALAEMISSMSKPTVSLVLGDSHSIGVPLAVSTNYSFITPTATMIIHPVRMNGTIIGAPQTFDYFKMIQERIVSFIADHSRIEKLTLDDMMIKQGILTKDLGTILVGQEAVDAGLIDEVGGISKAFAKLRELM
ncbi:MAG: ATP-dependent Clp protease proteolytic subunit [Lachnospira sp.]|nr:ATP-dependent Clp protease proteolytic subunit [Lachnospira sp.]